MPKPNVREQIVTTSLAMLQGQGYHATSVQDITAAAGVPKGSFYNHFASKEALGQEVVRRYIEGNAGRYAVLADASLAPLERIRRHFELLVAANVADHFHCGCLLGNFGTEMSAHSELIRIDIDSALNQWGATLAPLIEQAQQDGQVGLDFSAADLGRAVVDAWQGAVLRAKAGVSRAPLDLFMRTMMEKILR
jgi:TetR/AcrR family transcriptional repressor of nem operon